MGIVEGESFANDLAKLDPDLYDPSNVQDRSLNAIWNFADSFFDAKSHEFPTMEGIAWDEAFKLLQSSIEQLQKGEALENPLILSFARF
jgi:hypothetical protein